MCPLGSRHGQRVENLLDDVLRGDVFRLGLVADRDAMAQHVGREFLHVLRRDVAAAVEERRGARGQRQIDRGARRGAVLDVAVEIQPCGLRVARRQHHVHDVVPDLVVHVDRVDHAAGAG